MTVTATHLTTRLVEHGYRPVAVTSDHQIFERAGDRVVVPVHSDVVSAWVTRVIEWNLEDRLGRGWLTGSGAAPPPEPTRSRPRPLHLHVVIAAERERGGWRAFVPEEPRIVTFGRTLAETRRRADDAAAAWYGDEARVVLEPVVQLDDAARRWVERATASTAPPGTASRARDELVNLGLTTEDVDELLDVAATAA